MNTKKPGYLYVLHLTPCEIFVWNKLRSLAKNVGNQLRVAIPAEHEDIYLEWDPPGNLNCDENVLGRIVQKFCSAGVIVRIGDSEKGKTPYRFSDDPGTFYVNPVETHPEVTATPEFIELARKIMEGEFEEDVKRFQPGLYEWIEKNSSLKPSSTYIKLVGVRDGKSPAVGVFFKNPKWQPDHATEKRRYLIAVPGFTAHKLVEQSKKQLAEKRRQVVKQAQQIRSSKTITDPANEKYMELNVDELRETKAGIETDIQEIRKMLEQKQLELETVKKLLVVKLDQKLQDMDNERRLLQALRDKL